MGQSLHFSQLVALTTFSDLVHEAIELAKHTMHSPQAGTTSAQR
jgi:hypothetical protein